jgi:Na+-translocating ferredoxin:NAD+ oxidoreductase subunit B
MADNSASFAQFPSLPVSKAAPSLADQIEDLLPQTQCTKCGYPACRPYAEAIAAGAASYNQCPPGGAEGIARLAALLGKPIIPLNPANGVERPRQLAVIDESLCIGCTLCIQACPVDAIVGAAKQMHTVIPELCTGCDLCVAPCPVDCIAMVDATPGRTGWAAWSQEQADAARARHAKRVARLRREKEERLAAKAAAKLKVVEAEAALSPEEKAAQERKKAIIAAAIERARLRKEEMGALGAAPAATAASMHDVSPAVRRQIDAVNSRLEQREGAEDQGQPEQQDERP